MSSNIRVNRICLYCGNEFEAKTTVTKFCSALCNKRDYKARVKAGKIEESNKQTIKIKVQPLEELKAKEFLSIAETAKLIGISRRTVYRLIETQAIKLNKIGKRSIIKRSEIDKLFL